MEAQRSQGSFGGSKPTILSFASAEYTRDCDRANCLNTSACVASDIDCRSSCTKTQDLDRMPVETITVANQVQFKLQPVGKTFVCGDHRPVTLPKHMYFLAANMADNQNTSINACYSDFCYTTDSATHINAPLTSTPATPTLAAMLDLATPDPPIPSLSWVTSSMYTQTKHFAIELCGRPIRRHH
uniref:Uncharacterized protein n=1 Tax=Tanacetum cinerariifolium TaxID=118510 RepID=A0A6L2J5P0_TANCI|nr:hypothetical protein [Tanacetum cinerariifolium]